MQREASIDVSELIIGKTTENNHTLIPNRDSAAKRDPTAGLAPRAMKRTGNVPETEESKGFVGYDLASPGNEASIRFKFPAAG